MTCSLCSQEISVSPIQDGKEIFCCHGCHAVYSILAAKQQLYNFREHPVFKQAVRAGLISNPLLLEKIRAQDQLQEERQRLHLEIGEMWCPSCAELIRLVLLQEKGVNACLVDYATDLASIEFAPRCISQEEVMERIRSLGYRPLLLQDNREPKISRHLNLRFIIAAFCALNVMMFAYPLYATYFHSDDEGVGSLFAWISGVVSLPVITYSAWPILRRFWTGLKVGIWGMETLVVIGIAAAFGLSAYELFTGGTRVYFDSMTVVIAFVLLGKIIESKAKFSAKETLLLLARSLPRRGRKRLPDGSQAFVPIKEFTSGDLALVLAGEKIVLDGVVVEGEGSCNEALMTGEALPVGKKVGSKLLGGTHLLHGKLTYRVTASLEESALRNIIGSIEQEMGSKSHSFRPVDKIVHWFAPLVLVIAFSTVAACLLFGISDSDKSVVQTAILRCVSILLISCPCAIGIAAPLAEAHLINSLARLGVIVRNRNCLHFLGREDLFVFDKTGTITKGEFSVLEGLETLSQRHLSILKSLTAHSNHPIAKALFTAIQEPPLVVDKIEERIGRGMWSQLNNDTFLLGSASFMQENGIATTTHASGIVTMLFFAENHHLTATITLGDSVRAGVSELHKLSPNVVLLSGDGEAAVTAVAHKCAFTEWHWNYHPLQKREFLLSKQQQGHIVCMVGDGVNDAPALTAAHVGISMVTAADISIHVSDLLLTTDRLDLLPQIRQRAQKGRSIVQQNLFWAFFYNGVGIGLAAFGLLSPLFAAAAMVTSSLIVTLNSQRLNKL